MSYSPVHLAATRGDHRLMHELLLNPTVEVNAKNATTGINAFWIAANYGYSRVMCELNKAGIDIYNTH